VRAVSFILFMLFFLRVQGQCKLLSCVMNMISYFIYVLSLDKNKICYEHDKLLSYHVFSVHMITNMIVLLYH
jgi:hypothetical protein